MLIMSQKSHIANNIDVCPWPSRSPDINPTERVRDIMGRKLSTIYQLPQTVPQLIHKDRVAWNEMRQPDINHSILSILRRVPFLVLLRSNSVTFKAIGMRFS